MSADLEKRLSAERERADYAWRNTRTIEAARQEEMRKRDAAEALAVACRSSVKFDLLHYEKMARAYGNLGKEGEQTHATAEAEAQRLHELLAKIDALALTTPNAELCGGPSGPSERAPS